MTMSHEALDYVSRGHRRVSGWFGHADAFALCAIDQAQRSLRGNFLEIGVFKGRSAIFLGFLLKPGEDLVVCDPFGVEMEDAANQAENECWFPGLDRRTFEDNYRMFHPVLPRILQCPSSEIPTFELDRSFRLIHIDGSHLYEQVRLDIATARSILIEEGIVTFDDWCSPEFPGVAAAIWEEVFGGGLVPLLCTNSKLYGTWCNDAQSMRNDVMAELASIPCVKTLDFIVSGTRLTKVSIDKRRHRELIRGSTRRERVTWQAQRVGDWAMRRARSALHRGR